MTLPYAVLPFLPCFLLFAFRAYYAVSTGDRYKEDISPALRSTRKAENEPIPDSADRGLLSPAPLTKGFSR